MAVKYKDMAVRYKELVKKQKEDPFTLVELDIIAELEDYIDKKILAEKNPYSDIRIQRCIAEFDYDVVNEKKHTMSDIRKDKMFKELNGRFKDAGWKWKLHIDDGLDGPNMSGPDYWILSGK